MKLKLFCWLHICNLAWNDSVCILFADLDDSNLLKSIYHIFKELWNDWCTLVNANAVFVMCTLIIYDYYQRSLHFYIADVGAYIPLVLLSWWCHQIETFSALLTICDRGIPRTQRPVTRSLMFSLICAWINDWVSNYEAGDLRRHCSYFDATVMLQIALRYTMSLDVSNIEVYWLELRPLVNLKPILFTIELPSPSVDVDVDLGMNVGLDVHIDI